MRPALFAWLAVLAAPAAGLAQTGPFLATVTDPEVKLRAGPSDQFPETATLPKGAVVLVDHEEPNGWLAVQDGPGKMYSVSWVQMHFVDFDTTKPTPQNVLMVHDQEITLRAGQMGLAQPLNVARAKVPPGTILTVIGSKVTFEGKSWYPVAPPAGDFRYLPKQAVRYEKSANTSFVVRDTVPPPADPGVRPASGSTTPPTGGLRPPPGKADDKPAVQHPLWAQAEAAERQGNYDEAERLYFQLAGVMNGAGGDHDVANLCFTRIHTLREKRRAGGGAGMPPAGSPARPATTPPAAPANARDDRVRWSGKLVRTGVVLDGRETYALESGPGETMFYVTPAPGVDLKSQLGRRVDIRGNSYTRQGLSKPYVVVTAVEPGQ